MEFPCQPEPKGQVVDADYLEELGRIDGRERLKPEYPLNQIYQTAYEQAKWDYRYWCPECEIYLGREGFYEDFSGAPDYQEEKCSTCGTEVETRF